MARYRKALEDDLENGILGAVVTLSDGILFRCPCNERQVYVTSPPHVISFSPDGLLTLAGSVGYRENEALERPANWCHFNVKDGAVEMHADSKCPGFSSFLLHRLKGSS